MAETFLAVTLAALAFGVQIFCLLILKETRLNRRKIYYIGGIALLASLIVAAGRTFRIYALWQKDPLEHYLLPPYQSAAYFVPTRR
jgi:hypothetical protein